MYTKESIDAVFNSADIVKVFTEYADVRQVGHQYKCCCPLHKERTPSLLIDPGKNVWHCFGCGEGGNAVSIIMKMEGLTWIEAVKKIAAQEHLTLVPMDEQTAAKEEEQSQKRQAAKWAVAEIQKWFVEQLHHNSIEAEAAREYAYGRWGQEQCEKFGIGYAPRNSFALINFADKAGIKRELLLDLGFIKENENDKAQVYTTMRERITIPVRDRYGDPIAYTARDISGKADAKYYNNKTNVIFKKDRVIFGLSTAIKAAAKAKRFVLVEGAPDVLRLKIIGIDEAVASLGTAWSVEQFNELKRFAPSVTFIPDSDPPKGGNPYGAGVAAVMKNGATALRCGLDVTVREIPLGEEKADADSYITSLDVFNSLQDEHFGTWYGRRKLASATTETERAAALTDVADLLACIESEVTQTLCIETLSQIFGKPKLWRDSIKRAKGRANRLARQKGSTALNNDDAEIMSKLGFYVRDNCYFAPGREGGEPVRWSNFIVEPLFHIEAPSYSSNILKLINDAQGPRLVEISDEETIAQSKFAARCMKLNCVWRAKQDQLNSLCEYIVLKRVVATPIERLGWNKWHKFYAMGNGIIDESGKWIEVDEMGIVRTQKNTFYLPAFSIMHRGESDAYQFEQKFAHLKQNSWTLEEYVNRMVQVFGKNAMVSFLYVVACIMYDICRNVNSSFPILNVFGIKNSGKTQLGTCLMSFFGTQTGTVPTLGNTTVPALNDMLTAADNVMVHLDEYKNRINERTIDMLKNIWGGAGQNKKNMNGNGKAVQSYVNCGFFLSGQEIPKEDPALFTRVIFLRFNKTTFTDAETKAFQEFRHKSEEGCTGYTIRIQGWRKKFEAEYKDVYNSIHKSFLSDLGKSNIVSRMIDGWTMPLAVYRIIETEMELPFSYRELYRFCLDGIKAQANEVESNTEMADFWRLVNAGHMSGKVQEGASFVIKTVDSFQPKEKKEAIIFEQPKKILLLNYTSLLSIINPRSATQSGNINIDPASLMSYLKNMPEYLGTKQQRYKILTPSGYPDYEIAKKSSGFDQRLTKTIRTYAQCFDYDLLKQNYDLNLEITLRADYELDDED
jgi:DNA primase catalytic core